MWVCPKCKQRFVNTSQSHSCGSYSVENFLKNKSDHGVALFKAFLRAYDSIGPYTLHPVKTRVALLTKMRFASVNRIGTKFLSGHLVLTTAQPPELFHRIDNLNNRYFVHHFKIYTAKDLLPLKKYFKMAYATGNRDHIL
jgi:hypothetical protein